MVKTIDCNNFTIEKHKKPEEQMLPVSDSAKKALKECSKKGLFLQDYHCDGVDDKKFKEVCTFIASGKSPIEACRQSNVSIDGFFVFKHLNRENKELMDCFDEAFKSKGGVFIGRCEEVIDGLLSGKINSRTAEVALNGLFKLASIADKKYSDSPRIEVDARSVTVNQLDPEKMMELNKLITGR